MEELQLEPITLEADQLNKMVFSKWDEPSDHGVEGYEGWYIFADTNDGDFDAEKGAMTQFRLSLYNPQDKLIGTGRGGYYTGGVTGMIFNYPVTFTPPKPKKPKKPKPTKTTITLHNVEANWEKVEFELFGKVDPHVFQYSDSATLELTIDSNLKVTGKVIPFKS